MGSVIDKIIPIALSMEIPFTVSQLCEKLYGDCEQSHIVNTHIKVKRLVKQGYLVESKRERVNYHWTIFYKVVE